ncbi:MAG TPA: trypsin-like peptidase domain-containing protein [Oscillospiraceae bacterium]|nr:trypsin-like peptidase domain-containing protein [Oscillospiraceae bacterium]
MQKNILVRMTAAILVLLLVSTFSACGKRNYTVTFDLNGGGLVSGETVQTVAEGSSAVAPEATNGRLELSWDKDFTNVTGDMTVTAQWNKVAMSTTDLAAYVQERTVTVNVETITGGSAAGSGFFIDDQGTIVTNYHVIDGATSMSVEVSDGATYSVQKIIDFSQVYDLALLKIDVTGNSYLELSAESVKTGEQVYAVGSALGTLTGSFTAGTVSSTSRAVGMIDCIQMDAAISSGNSGGPLVNIYGDVVGINTYSYVDGENLNLAIKPSTLDVLPRDKNYTVNDYKEWYITETSRSYSPYDGTNYYYSTVNTYQVVSGAECLYSVDSYGNYSEGYYDCSEFYMYDYAVSEYDAYVTYLKSIGFVFQDSETFDEGTSYYYMNEKDGILVDLFITLDNANLFIWVSE